MRGVELAPDRCAYPAWSLFLSSASVGLGLLLAMLPSRAWFAMLLYGTGNGIRTVVRGTLPLALNGQCEYAAVMGRPARLPLLGQAITPVTCGYIAEGLGLGPLLYAMVVVATTNLDLSVAALGYAVCLEHTKILYL